MKYCWPIEEKFVKKIDRKSSKAHKIYPHAVDFFAPPWNAHNRSRGWNCY
ncbi:MAG: hypothetical protein V1847_03955 [Candidatus Diapherotrites archaeon]